VLPIPNRKPNPSLAELPLAGLIITGASLKAACGLGLSPNRGRWSWRRRLNHRLSGVVGWGRVRAVFHHGLAVALLAAFLQGPFVHTHDDAAGHVHWDDLLHLRLADLPTQEVSLEAPGDGSDARFQDWVSSRGEVRVQLLADLCTPIPYPSLERHAAPRIWKAPRSHDPPWRLNLSPRAPPV
jgi:hypothetical protein